MSGRKKTYFCDNCNFKTYAPVLLKRHKSTYKCLRVTNNPSRNIECLYCSTLFTEKGIEIHKKNNKLYHECVDSEEYNYMTKDCSCNNFIYDGLRHEDFGTIYKIELKILLKRKKEIAERKKKYQEYLKQQQEEEETEEEESDSELYNSDIYCDVCGLKEYDYLPYRLKQAWKGSYCECVEEEETTEIQENIKMDIN